MKRRDFLKGAACLVTGASALASAPAKALEAEGGKNCASNIDSVDDISFDEPLSQCRPIPSDAGVDNFDDVFESLWRDVTRLRPSNILSIWCRADFYSYLDKKSRQPGMVWKDECYALARPLEVKEVSAASAAVTGYARQLYFKSARVYRSPEIEDPYRIVLFDRNGDVISKARQQKVFLQMTPSGSGINEFLRHCEKQVEQRFLEKTGWPVRIHCTRKGDT